MKTATVAAGDLPGIISVHRVRPEYWDRPTCSLLGAGPWLPRPWPRVVNLPPLALAYRLHLDGLDAARVWARLHELAGDAEPILTNDADPRKPNLMQRRMIAEWFARTLGEEVPDLTGPTLPLVNVLGFDPWEA